MSAAQRPEGEIVVYQAADGGGRIRVLLEGDSVWLTQAQIAELFQTTPQNIIMHLAAICAEGEIAEPATCKEYLQVQTEWERQVERAADGAEAAWRRRQMNASCIPDIPLMQSAISFELKHADGEIMRLLREVAE